MVVVEGPIEFSEGSINNATYFRGCGDSWSGCLSGNLEALWPCSGAYARLQGYVVSGGSGFLDDPCGRERFHVVEVLEARLCTEDDCGCYEPIACESWCSTSGQCLDGQKCAPWSLPGALEAAWSCAAVPGQPAGVGEPCEEDSEVPWVDDCGLDSTCIDGLCRRLCDTDAECGEQVCAAHLCFDACDPLAPVCGEGQECRERSRGFVCIDVGASPERGPLVCHEQICGPSEACDGNVRCGDGCCQPVCDLTNPQCPDGVSCVPWGQSKDIGVCDL